MDIGKVFSGIVVFFIAIVELLLGLRFVFKLLAANSSAEFTNSIYAATEPIVSPFLGVFPSFNVAQFTLEIPTALAMIIYGIVGIILLQIAKYFEGLRIKGQHVAPLAQAINQSTQTPNPPSPPVIPAQPIQPVQPMQQPSVTQYTPPQTPVVPPQTEASTIQPPPAVPSQPIASGDSTQNSPIQ